MYLPLLLLVLLFSFSPSSALRGALIREGRSVKDASPDLEMFHRSIRVPLRPFRAFDGYYSDEYYTYPSRKQRLNQEH